MRPVACVILMSLLLAPGDRAAGDERPGQLSAPQAAQQVLAAFQSEDAKTLAALAAEENPDPWLVADILCAQGAFDAAAAFASAAPRTLVEKLPAFVASQRKDARPARRALLATMLQALAAGKLEAALDAADRMQGEPDDVTGVRIAQGRALLLERLARRKECIAAYKRAAEAALGLGWYERAGRSFLDAGYVAMEDKDLPTAQAYFESMLAVAKRIDIKSAVASAHRNLGIVLRRQRRHAEALEHLREALPIYEAHGAEADASRIASTIGQVLRESGDNVTARAYFERALRSARRRGDRAAEARYLIPLGMTYQALADYPRALSLVKRARDIADALQVPQLIRSALFGLGAVYCSLGDYPKALAAHERALWISETLKDPQGVMTALGNIGVVYGDLGHGDRALAYFERSLETAQAHHHAPSIAMILGNLGSVHAAQGDYERALDLFHRSLELAESIGYIDAAQLALSNLGLAYAHTGNTEKARIWIAKYQRYAEEAGDKLSAAGALAQLAGLHRELGEYDQAVELLNRAVRTFERLRATRHLVHYLAELALVRLRAGQAEGALATARRGMPHLEALLGGLGEEEASAARTRHARIFEIGTLAALQVGETADALHFLESGRAGALLESLGGRSALHWADLPKPLRQAEAEAKKAQAQARRAHGSALRSGSLKQARRAGRELDQAQERVRDLAGRIQREAKSLAGLFYPRAATLEELKDLLDERTALVLYGVCEKEAVALVVTKRGQHSAALGQADELGAVCDALRFNNTEGTAEEAVRALDTARRRLVAPLALPDTVRSVLISPVGPLSYLPFNLLFDKYVVACVPSGTTWALLLDEERDRGKDVLALGDPKYGEASSAGAAAFYQGGALVALPGTREEARRVGDVVLLGDQATEAGLRDALAKRPRWRAVHFACHGLVDPERPVLSSLALTRTANDDGFLTALEVLRMQIPTDLAVLSACETAKGKIVRGEGILGLMRAFMYAGAPRVICSLWKVDDESTRALMVKFYELWQAPLAEGDAAPRRGAAAALREAQAFVRGHEKWKHPYFWAAWVLWGLAD